MRELLRKSPRYFLLVALAGLALRLLFILRFPSITADSLIYGDIAKNWMQHGIYGVSDNGNFAATDIRLPGYPAFLVVIFAIFGMEHYRTVLVVQMLVDLGTCLIIVDMARRTISPRAAKAAFLLAALCPFLANYAAAALTETLEIFFTALALDRAIAGLEGCRLRPWVGCGLATAAAILLRPDGGLLLIAVGGYLLILLVRSIADRTQAGVASALAQARSAPHILRAGTILVVVALAPLVPWTLRNLRTLHRFQPLAPRYANAENEFVPVGFNRWVKTWMADYASVEEIYWPAPGNEVDASKLPDRAFDSDAQCQETLQLLADYNDALHFDPGLDVRFAKLAAERIHDAPLRYYVWLPLLRIADMWLRPRTELLPADTRWWEFNDDPEWSVLAVALGVINLGYVVGACLGLLRWRSIAFVGLMTFFVVLRSAFLGTLENPEPRYTLECYPVVTTLMAALFT